MNGAYYILLILILPLLSFMVLGVFGRKYVSRWSGFIGTLSMLLTTIISIYTAYLYFSTYGSAGGNLYNEIIAFDYNWLNFSPGLSINMGILLDPISMMMISVISFISLMVHIFSLGYMKGEERFATYYSFLSLFTFSMLGLVLSSNIFQLYIFWELVGVSSFLLIGFYYSKPAAVAAAKKAFIVTRFADLGFLIGILILGFYSNTFDFTSLISRLTTQPEAYKTMAAASFLGLPVLTWALSLVFIGGAGKSAMFPLHIWLPDAMEGPTPVSALIHAATMVVAGVFLVARLFPVFRMDEIAMEIVTWVGALSALLAAIIACVQRDIKRVLAYSTMSQIGYMMFSLGVVGKADDQSTGYVASMFHLFTHAFFKSLLFLCAGVIIHYVHSNDIKAMGGLRKILPLTHAAFLVGCLSIAGVPPFSGFFSKEMILAWTYQSNRAVLFIGLFSAALTAFYMFRLYFSIFWNKEAVQNVKAHADGTLSMKAPLIILMLCSASAGFVPFHNYVTPAGSAVQPHFDLLFSLLPISLVVVSILLAAYLYKKENSKPSRLASSFGGFYRIVMRKFYIDEIYLFITQKIIFNLVGRPAAWMDKHIVDGFMNRLGMVTTATSEKIKHIQSGRIQSYALYFFGGVAGLTLVFIYIWK